MSKDKFPAPNKPVAEKMPALKREFPGMKEERIPPPPAPPPKDSVVAAIKSGKIAKLRK